jgi:hypothetical protein
VSVMLDFNRSNLSERPISKLINELIEQAEPPGENYRQYLGASAIGSECLRKIQFDWMCDPKFPGRIKDIFARGHFFEDVTRQHLVAAGFRFAPPEQLEFKAAGELFRGHADGSLVAGPYAAQVAVYQAYLDVTNPALFSAVNADTAERVHFLVPFEAGLAQAFSDRAVMVIEATRSGELLSRVSEDPEDWRCKMCSHRERCWK